MRASLIFSIAPRKRHHRVRLQPTDAYALQILAAADIYSSRLTVSDFQALNPWNYWWYRVTRHPLVSNVLLPHLVLTLLYCKSVTGRLKSQKLFLSDLGSKLLPPEQSRQSEMRQLDALTSEAKFRKALFEVVAQKWHAEQVLTAMLMCGSRIERVRASLCPLLSAVIAAADPG